MHKWSMLLCAALLLAPGSASAQYLREYECSNSSETTRYLIGPGELRYFTKGGEWSPNLCDPESSCTFSGTQFRGENEGLIAQFDTVTGRISIDTIMWDSRFDGTCRQK